MKKHISLAWNAVILAFAAITAAGVKTALDTISSVSSSDPSILSIENISGTWIGALHQPGTVVITVVGTDGEGNPISSNQEIEIYDPAALATHFDLEITQYTPPLQKSSALTDAETTGETAVANPTDTAENPA